MVFTVFVLTLLMCNTRVVAGAVITCDAPSVKKGEPANITCHFNEDVSITKKNIKVQHRPPGSASFNPDDVNSILDCYWLNADDFNCNRGEGFEVIGKVAKTATLRLSNAETKNEGKYMCEVVPSDPSDIKACDFRLSDDPTAVIISVPGQDQKPISEVGNHVRADLAFAVATFIVMVILTLIIAIIFKDRLASFLQECLPSKTPKSKIDVEMQQIAQETLASEEDAENNYLLVKKRPETSVSEKEDVASATAVKDQTKEIQAEKPAHDPDEIQIRIPVEKGVHLELTEKIKRGQEALQWKLSEDDAVEKLEEIKKTNAEARSREEEEDKEKNVNEGGLGKKERNKRMKAADERRKKQEAAEEYLKKIRREKEKKRAEIKDKDLATLRKAAKHNA